MASPTGEALAGGGRGGKRREPAHLRAHRWRTTQASRFRMNGKDLCNGGKGNDRSILVCEVEKSIEKSLTREPH